MEFHPIAQPTPIKYMNTIAPIAPLFADGDPPSLGDGITVRYTAM